MAYRVAQQFCPEGNRPETHRKTLLRTLGKVSGGSPWGFQAISDRTTLLGQTVGTANIFCRKLFFVSKEQLLLKLLSKRPFFAAPDHLTIPLNKLSWILQQNRLSRHHLEHWYSSRNSRVSWKSQNFEHN